MNRGWSHVLLALGVMLPASLTRADYDKTRWGMTVEEVSKLYPNGNLHTFDDGTKLYLASREVALMQTSSGFFFDDLGHLDHVLVVFAEQVDSEGAKGMSRETAGQYGSLLRAELVKRYGLPTRTMMKGDALAEGWVRRNHDVVILIQVWCQPTGCNPQIFYSTEDRIKRGKGKGL
jgi:hypothetical protein